MREICFQKLKIFCNFIFACSYHMHERNILGKYENKSKHGFKRLFRMTKTTFDLLNEELSSVLPDGRSTNGRSMTGKEKLLSFLYTVGGNCN